MKLKYYPESRILFQFYYMMKNLQLCMKLKWNIKVQEKAVNMEII